jgi:hypothetical protein
MKISCHGLTIELIPLRSFDDEGWCRVQVQAVVPGFEGNCEAWLQSADLVRFESQIGAMYESVGLPGTATLASAEPDLEVVLTMQRMGGVSGRYRLESERRDGVPTVLSGAFEMDQSFLPALQGSVGELLSDLGGHHEA